MCLTTYPEVLIGLYKCFDSISEDIVYDLYNFFCFKKTSVITTHMAILKNVQSELKEDVMK